MIREQLEKVISGKNLNLNEAEQVMLQIMEGNENQAQIASLLTALKCKGETSEEVAGFASAMRKKSKKLINAPANTIDVCGTGGDNSGTFNISTATAFVVAAAGVPVAKHGNRSISSKSGSADVLMELGAPVNLSSERSAEALNKIGITFLFAPDYHPAMKHVAPVRRELAMKTVFNILGPLTNPAGTKKQLIGTYDDRTAKLMFEAAALLDMEKVCFICTGNRYDEIMLDHTTTVYEFRAGKNQKFKISNTTFDYPKVNPDEIKGESSSYNADLIKRLFQQKEKNAAFYVVSANAALALYVAGISEDIKKCAGIAEKTILSGAAAKKLEEFIAFRENDQ
jgi:anthranilate phosphoribosyltransferase